MHHVIRSLAVSALSLAAQAGAGAAERFEVVGGQGFDWTRPDQARCAAITADAARRFGACRFEATGAFGLPLAHHLCPLKGGGEVVVFRNRAQCREALETMQANAP